jgi:protein-tyrosine phosphatase
MGHDAYWTRFGGKEDSFESVGIRTPDFSGPIFRIHPVMNLPGLYRSSRPGYSQKRVSKETLKDALLAMKEDGITNVACLLTDGEYFSYYGKDLVRYYRSMGFKVHRFPIMDFSVPRVEAAYQLAVEVLAAINEGKKVLVHCSAGIGRTGLAINCILQLYGALKKVDLGKVPSETSQQRAFTTTFRHHLSRLGILKKKKPKKKRRKKNDKHKGVS